MPLPTQLKHVARRLGRTPGFTLLTLLTLAIGIGANAAIFSVVQGVLLRPLPYPRPDELVAVWHTAPGVGISDLEAAPFLYFTYREHGRAFRDVGLWARRSVTVTGLAEPERVSALRVTDGTLPTLGVAPQLGRTFSTQEAMEGAAQTVVLSDAFWRSRFGGDAGAIGRRLVVDGEPTEIIGVMPREFRFLDTRAALFLPLQLDRAKVTLGQFSYGAVARLEPGATLEQASADVARMLPMAFDSFPAPPGFDKKMFVEARIAPNLRPFKRDLIGDVGKVLWVLMGTIGMVLLIACANVANLLLVRAEGRQQELAVRAALGAGWTELARQILLESLALALAGGVLGLGLARVLIRLLVFLAPANLPRLDAIAIDPHVMAFTFALSLAAGVLLSLLPILKYAGRHAAPTLRAGGRSASQSRERHRARNGLVVLQVALALVLLVSSGLMIRSFQALRDVEPGFEGPGEVQTMRISIPDKQVGDEEAAARMQQAILDELARLPGVTAAGMTSSVPLDGAGWHDPLFAQDRTYAEGQLPALRLFRFTAPGFFHALGTPLLAGRDFTWKETYARLPVVIVSDGLARELWGSSHAAIGKRVRETHRSAWREVVGVAADIRHDGLDRKAPATVYWPILMKEFEADGMARSLAFVVRSPRAGTEGLLKEIREAVWSVNSNLPLASVETLESLCERSMARTSFTMVMLVLAGAMALLLGVVGIYAVISYAVSQRSREIGIRMALGARREDLTRMFVRQGVLLGTIGAAFGLLGALGLGRVMSSLLFGVAASDPLTLGLVAAGLVSAAGFASYLPARRVAAVDPVEALRAE